MVQKVSDLKLKNGFKAILAPNNSVRLVTVQLFVRIGSAWEQPGESGYSHFTEHLLFKSTKNFPNNTVMSEASFLGGMVNAYTEFDSTCFYLTLPSEYLKEGLFLISDIVRNANFSDEDFYFEKNVVLEELKQYQNDPEDFFLENIPAHYFTHNPYRNPIIGKKENLLKAKPGNLRNFYKKYYTPENSFLVLSGDFNSDNILNLLNNFFSDWKPSLVEKFQVDPERFPEKPKVIRIINGKVTNPLLAFAVPEISGFSKEALALSIITKIFTLGKKSRLYSRLYLEDKLIDSIKVESLSGLYEGMSIILILPKSTKYIEKIIDIFLEEFNQIRHLGIRDEEINEAVNDFINTWKFSQEYIEEFGMNLGCEEIIDSYKSYLKYPDLLKEVKYQDLVAGIEKYFDSKSLYFFYLNNKELNHGDILQKITNLHKRKYYSCSNKNFYETILDNGLKVLLKKVRNKPTIGFSVCYDVSHLNEDITNRSCNAITFSSILHGSINYTYEELLKYTSKNGIIISASPSTELSYLRLKCFNNNIINSLNVLGDIMFLPRFPLEHINNIQKTMISNLSRIKDYPMSYALLLWKTLIFGKNSNLISKEGKKTDIRNISRKKIIHWYNSFLKPENACISIVGNYDFDNLLFNLDAVFSKKMKIQKEKAKYIFDLDKQTNKKNIVLRDNCFQKGLYKRSKTDFDQSIILVGGVCNGSSNIKDLAYSHLLAEIVGGDMNSRMYTELREKRGLAYSTGFDIRSLQDFGFFLAYAIVDKHKENEAYSLILDIFSDVIRDGVTETELQIAKNLEMGNRRREEESMLFQAKIISAIDRLDYEKNYYEKLNVEILKAKVNDLQNWAEKYFQKDSLTTYILS